MYRHSGRVYGLRTSIPFFLMVLGACVLRIPEATDETTGDTSVPVTETSAPVITTGVGGTTIDSTTGEISTGGDVSAGVGESTMAFPDLWPKSCDIWAQDCPAGQKCAPHTVPDGWYGDTWCVPVVDDPGQVGDPCVLINGPYSGRDDCEAGAFCWEYVEGGVCMAVCTGSSAAPTCEGTDLCNVFVPDVLPLCLDSCHPLTQDCDAGEICVPILYESLDFMCVPAVPQDDGGAHAPCTSTNVCEPGFYCAYMTAAVECEPPEGTSSCCEPFCDLGAPNTCPGQGQVCEPWYFDDSAPEGFANVGTCEAPQ